MSEFSGSERTVAGYLLAEVLERQPPEVRDLLLRTSILERVSGPLGRCADRRHGRRGDPPAARRPERLRHRARRRPHLVPLPPPVRRSAAPRVAAHRAGERSRRCTAPRPPGTKRRATSSKPSATIRPPVTGRRLRACSLDNYLTLTMAGRGETLHALLGVFPADAHLGDGNLAAALAIDNILHGLLDEAAAQLGRRSATGGGGSGRADGASSTCTWPSSRPSSPAGAAICPRLRKQCARLEAALGATADDKRAARAAGLLGARAHEPGHRGAVGRPSRRRTAAPRGRPRRARAGSHGPSSRSAASRTSQSRRRSPGSRCRSRSS